VQMRLAWGPLNSSGTQKLLTGRQPVSEFFDKQIFTLSLESGNPVFTLNPARISGRLAF